jgi:hypothetical protein
MDIEVHLTDTVASYCIVNSSDKITNIISIKPKTSPYFNNFMKTFKYKYIINKNNSLLPCE